MVRLIPAFLDASARAWSSLLQSPSRKEWSVRRTLSQSLGGRRILSNPRRLRDSTIQRQGDHRQAWRLGIQAGGSRTRDPADRRPWRRDADLGHGDMARSSPELKGPNLEP